MDLAVLYVESNQADFGVDLHCSTNDTESVKIASAHIRNGVFPVHMCVSSNGSRLATSTDCGVIMVWDIVANIILVRFAHARSVATACFSDVCGKLAFRDEIGAILVLDLVTHDIMLNIPQSEELAFIYELFYCFEDTRLLCVDKSRVLTLWDATTGTIHKQFPELNQGADHGVECCALCPAHSTFAGGSGPLAAVMVDVTIKVVDLETSVLLFSIRTNIFNLNTTMELIFSGDGQRLALSVLYENVRIWDMSSQRQVASVNVGVGLGRYSLNFDGTKLAVGEQSTGVRIIDVQSNETLRQIDGGFIPKFYHPLVVLL